MKFLEMVEALQQEEKSRNKIILVKCGVFFVAIGRDVVLLHEILSLNVTCIKPSICKVGMPISNCMKYTDKLEKKGYGYILYDYNSQTKKVEEKYTYEAKASNEEYIMWLYEMLNSKKKSIARFYLESLDGEKIKIIGYDGIADFCYSRLNKSDSIFLYGFLAKSEVEIKRIKIL